MAGDRQKTSDKTIQIEQATFAEQMKQAAGKRACFLVIGGIDVGNVIPIDKSVIVMGRDPDCDVVLRDDGISRNHVKVRLVALDRILVQDLDSTNGTFVGGERIREATLLDGDKILLGRRTVLKFVFQDEIEASYQKQMYESSTQDALTGAYNRKYFNQKINTDLSLARRHQMYFSLAVFDLDHFKKVNDTYGHRTGDSVLVSVVRAVQHTIRTEDTIARYGGEEFAVIAQGTNFAGGKVLGERMRLGVEKLEIPAVDGSGEILRVTISTGVATVPPGVVADPQTVFSLADANLYEAKRGGRNMVVASEMGTIGGNRETIGYNG